jgi:hypothetical protein
MHNTREEKMSSERKGKSLTVILPIYGEKEDGSVNILVRYSKSIEFFGCRNHSSD